MCVQCIQIYGRFVYLSRGLKDLENIDSDMFNKSRSGRQPILNEEHLKETTELNLRQGAEIWAQILNVP